MTVAGSQGQPILCHPVQPHPAAMEARPAASAEPVFVHQHSQSWAQPRESHNQ